MWGENDELIATAQQLTTPPARNAPPSEDWGADDEIVATREGNDYLREYHAKRLMEARRQDAASAVSSMPAIVREPFHAFARGGANVMSTATRPFSKDTADYFAETGQQIDTRAEATRKDDWSPWLSRTFGGAIQSVAQSAIAAPAGPAGMIGSFAATEANQALYDAEQAGLKGNDRIKYAVVQGAIEGAIAGTFQKFAPGLERFIPQIAGGAMKLSGKQFLKMTAQELPEEILTELGHAIAEASYGIDPKATDTQQLVSRMVDTVGQTLATLGLAQGAARLTHNRQQVETLEGIRSKGFVSEQEAKDLGLTPEESKNRATRKAAVDKRIQETQREIERAQEVQPEAEVRQEQPAPAAEVLTEATGRAVGAPGAPGIPTDIPAGAPVVAPAPEVPIDEARVEQIIKEKWGGRTGHRAQDALREQYARKQAAEEAKAAAPEATATPEAVQQPEPPPLQAQETIAAAPKRGRKPNPLDKWLATQPPGMRDVVRHNSGEMIKSGKYMAFSPEKWDTDPDAVAKRDAYIEAIRQQGYEVKNLHYVKKDHSVLGEIVPAAKQSEERLTVQETGAGKPPQAGRVVAAIGADGKIYYGEPGQIHADLLQYRSVAEGVDHGSDNMGFADQSGRFVSRKDATWETLRAVPVPAPTKKGRKPKPQPPPEVAQEPAEFGRDVADVQGAVGVPISREKGTAGKSVQHFFQRFFTSRGELPQEVYDAKVRKEGRVAKEMSHLRFASEDFKRGVKTALGGKELTQADVEQMNAVLRGEADETKVPEQVRAPLRAMRDHIDSLSRSLISEGVAQGDLVGTITENMGLYTTRSYRVFDDPKWRDKVPPAVRNRAVAAIRQMDPGKSDAEVQGLLESLLFRGAADSPSALLKGSKLGSKDLSTFMKRKDVPEWLRDLWGEYKDAGVNYARSVFKMSHLLANQQFLNSVKESGSGKWLRTAKDGPVVNEYGDVITPIAAEGSSTMEPLNGMYTTPEIKKAFERLDSPSAVPEWLRVLMSVNYAVKYSKTVGSMMTHVRNLISNTGFAVANGHWRLDKSGKALWGTATGTFKLSDAKFRAYYERAAELGLVGEDVRAGELKDALRDASQADIDEFLYNPQARQAKKIVSTGRKGVRLINSLYQAEDGVWKLYAWENEKARYAKAHPDWSQEQVEQRAAEIVRDTYPTYSKIPEAVKGLRRFPLVGTFVSFPSEVVRTTFHTIELGVKEMQSPETREIGAQRLAGTVVSLGALSVLSRAMMAMFGIGDDEDEDLRWFVPPWQENSRFIYTDKPKDATYKFVDLGYSDPHAYLTDAAVAFMRGDDWKDSLTKALGEFLRPFASEEILAKTLMDVRGNEDQKVFNSKDAAGEQAKDIIAYVWGKALEPGTIASLKRIKTAIEGTDPNLETKNEVLAMTTGQRLQKVDVEHSLGFRVREFEKALNDIQSIARKTATSRGTATGEMVATDRERMEKLRLAEFAQMQKILGAARRLGVPEEKIRALVSGELSAPVAKQVMSGDYAPYEMSPQTVKQMLEANPAEFKERFSAWHGEKLPEAVGELRRKGNAAALRKLSDE